MAQHSQVPEHHTTNPDMFLKNIPPMEAPPFKQTVEPKGERVPEAVRSKHERSTSQEGGDLRRLTGSPLHPETVRQKPVTDLSHQHHDGVKPGSNKSESDTQRGLDALRPKHERRPSQEDGDLGRPMDSPLRHVTVTRRTPVESPHHRHGGISTGDTPKRVMRQTDQSVEHSPLHPQYQSRVGGKNSGVSSPSWERKGSSEGSHGASSTPGRSRLRPVTRGDDTPDQSTAIPIFGDWDEADPSAAEGYSHIFNIAREERQTAAGKVPIMPTESSYSRAQKQYGKDNSKSCWCFPWGKK